MRHNSKICDFSVLRGVLRNEARRATTEEAFSAVEVPGDLAVGCECGGLNISFIYILLPVVGRKISMRHQGARSEVVYFRAR